MNEEHFEELVTRLRSDLDKTDAVAKTLKDHITTKILPVLADLESLVAKTNERLSRTDVISRLDEFDNDLTAAIRRLAEISPADAGNIDVSAAIEAFKRKQTITTLSEIQEEKKALISRLAAACAKMNDAVNLAFAEWMKARQEVQTLFLRHASTPGPLMN